MNQGKRLKFIGAILAFLVYSWVGYSQSKNEQKIDPWVVKKLKSFATKFRPYLIFSPGPKKVMLRWQSPNEPSKSDPLKTQELFIPKASSLSTRQFDIVSGTQLDLRLEHSQPPTSIAIKWIKDEHILCLTPSCRVLTSGWGPGIHHVDAIISGDGGFSLYRFKINIKFRQEEKQPESPSIEREQTPVPDQTLSKKDLFIRTIQGKAYYNSRANQIAILNQIPKELEWNGTITTQGNTMVQFGQSKTFEYYMWEGSQIRFLDSEVGSIELREGRLRSRNLNNSRTNKITISDRVSIQGLNGSDLLVQVQIHSSETKINLHCLVGPCLFQWPRPQKLLPFSESELTQQLYKESNRITDQEKSSLLILTSGDSISYITAPQSSPTLIEGDSQTIYNMLMESTPFYLDQTQWRKALSDKKPLRQIFPNSSESTIRVTDHSKTPRPKYLIKRLEKALERRQSFKALELLYSIGDQYEETPEYIQLKAVIDLNLQLYKQAYHDTKALRTHTPHRHYLMAMALLMDGKFQRATDLFDKVKPPLADSIPLIYYKSVAAFYSEGFREAKRGFTQVIWQTPSSPYGKSSSMFMDLIASEKKWSAEATTWLLQDSNVYNSSTSNSIIKDTYGIAPISSLGYGLDFDIGRNIFADTQVRGDLKILGQFFSFHHQEAKHAQNSRLTIQQEIKVDTGSKAKPGVSVSCIVFIERIQASPSSNADGFGMKLKSRLLNSKLKPGFYLINRQYLDPDPTGDTVRDPLTSEPSLPTDRSGRYLTLGIPIRVYETNNIYMDSILEHTLHERRASTSLSDSYNETAISLALINKWTQTMRHKASLSIGNQTYPNDLTGRTDNLIHLATSIGWLISPLNTIKAELSYKTISSSNAQKSYNRYIAKIGYGLFY